MRRIQAKQHKIETYEIEKIYYRVFMIKDLFQMMKFIRWLIFIKIVLQVVKRFKKAVIKKKALKKIVIKKGIPTDDQKQEEI